MHPRAWLPALCATLCLFLVTAPAGATITEALSLDELVQRSDQVLLVECTASQALREGDRRIVTDFTVRVEEVHRGSATVGAELVVRSLGGEIGDLGMRVEGEPRLQVGNRYLVFLRSLHGVLRPVGMSQGVMPLRGQIVLPGGAGLALRQRVNGGQLAPAPPAILHPEPYDDVVQRIRTSPR